MNLQKAILLPIGKNNSNNRVIVNKNLDATTHLEGIDDKIKQGNLLSIHLWAHGPQKRKAPESRAGSCFLEALVGAAEPSLLFLIENEAKSSEKEVYFLMGSL